MLLLAASTPVVVAAQTTETTISEGQTDDPNGRTETSDNADGVAPSPNSVPPQDTAPADTTAPTDTTASPDTTQPPPTTAPTETTAPVASTAPDSTPAPETSLAPETSQPEDQKTDGSVDEGQDVLANEPEGEDAPATDETVPPKGTYGEQGAYTPPDVLWSSVAEAEKKLETTKLGRIEVIARIRLLRIRLKELERQQSELSDESQAGIDRLAEASDRMRSRAVIGFRRNVSGNGSEPSLTDYRQTIDLQRRTKMVGAALLADRSGLDQLGELRGALNIEALQIVDRIKIVNDSITEAGNELEALDMAAEQALIEYEAFKAGSELFIDGVVFPIAGPASAPYDSFGFPRMPGTPDEHWHEGIDLFAPRGTPLVATERGVITRVGVGRLGGLKFWLKGESGSEWYYAHLDSFAPGLADGLVVDAGQLVGYVGNTGNAVGTPPHLHMELHPNGDRPVNPFPLLKVVYDLDRAAEAAGNHPGYSYELFVAARADQVAAQPPTSGSSVPDSSVPEPTTATTEPGATIAPETVTTSTPTTQVPASTEPAAAPGPDPTEAPVPATAAPSPVEAPTPDPTAAVASPDSTDPPPADSAPGQEPAPSDPEAAAAQPKPEG